MIEAHIAKTAGEWRETVLDRDGHMCASEIHDPTCHDDRGPLRAHHIVYKSHLSPRSLWIVQNGIALSDACHCLAHSTHNVSIGLKRANAAVAVVNCFEWITVPKFTKSKIRS